MRHIKPITGIKSAQASYYEVSGKMACLVYLALLNKIIAQCPKLAEYAKDLSGWGLDIGSCSCKPCD